MREFSSVIPENLIAIGTMRYNVYGKRYYIFANFSSIVLQRSEGGVLEPGWHCWQRRHEELEIQRGTCADIIRCRGGEGGGVVRR